MLNQSIIAIESIHDIADRSATDPSNLKVNEGYITSYDGEQELREDAFLMSALGKLLPLFRMHLIKTSGNYVDIISQINELEENIQTNIKTERALMAHDARTGRAQNVSNGNVSVDGSEGASSPPRDNDNMDSVTGISTVGHGGSISFTYVALI